MSEKLIKNTKKYLQHRIKEYIFAGEMITFYHKTLNFEL